MGTQGCRLDAAFTTKNWSRASFLKAMMLLRSTTIVFWTMRYATSGTESGIRRYGYGFNLGSRGTLLTGDDYWRPGSAPTAGKTVHLYKLHGSLHFQFSGDEEKPTVNLKQRPYTKQYGDLKFSIIPPEWHKAYDKGAYARMWQKAAMAINKANHIVLIGYSLPLTDLHATALFRTSIRDRSLRSLVTVNPDRDSRRRTRSVLLRGLTDKTRILSVDRLSEFVALDRSVWDV